MDWADEKAREWSDKTARCNMKPGTAGFEIDLAALLREVEQDAYVMRDRQLSKLRGQVPRKTEIIT